MATSVPPVRRGPTWTVIIKQHKVVSAVVALAVVALTIAVANHGSGGGAAYACDYDFSPDGVELGIPGLDNDPGGDFLGETLDVLDTYCPNGTSGPAGSADPLSAITSGIPFGNGGYFNATMSSWKKENQGEVQYCTLSFTADGKSQTEAVWATTSQIGQAACSALQG